MRHKGTWLTTFSDVVTLLITFFTLILSMSSMDTKIIKKSFNFFIGGVGILNYGNNSSIIYERIKKEIGEPLVINELKIIYQLMLKFSLPPKKAYKLYLLKQKLKNFKYKFKIVNYNDIIIYINVSEMFSPASYELTDFGKLFAQNLSEVLQNSKGDVILKMYTSNFPIETDIVKDNIDLSIKRVSKIVDFLKNKNNNINVLVMGWGNLKKKENLLEIDLKDYLKISRRKSNG